MTATIVSSKKDLPADTEKLRDYSWKLTLAHQQLIEKYNKLIRQHWGKSSEKLDDTETLNALQTEMDELLNQLRACEQETQNAEPEQFVEITLRRRRRKKTGRDAIPEELITDVILDIEESEKICDCCGKEMPSIGTKEHLVVERIPATWKATRYIRPVYGCSSCKDTVHLAEPVHLPIAKGLAGPLLLTFVILSKYMYHLPLYRIQRQIFHESGIWFTRTTLASWVGQVSGILGRIYQKLLEQYRQSRIKHADETPFSVFRDGKYRESYMWVGVTGDNRTAVFNYHKHRSSKAALQLLEGSNPGDYLMADDCPSYHSVIKKLHLIDLRCMVHIRRKFFEAYESGLHRDLNKKILIKIGQLYRIERYANRHNLNTDERGTLRSKYSTQIMAKIKRLLLEPGITILPKSGTGIARDYFLKNWEQANRFLDNGELPIDNSVNERIIRPFAIGRNNWGQTGSENGARWMGCLYTIITTCKLNGIDPHAYIADVIMRLPIRPVNSDIKDLMPVEWYKAKNNGKIPDVKEMYPSKI